MTFPCSKCGKVLKSKQNLDYHIKNVVCRSKAVACTHCEKLFSSSSSMHNHLKRCPKNDIININAMQNQIKEMREEIENLRKVSSTTINQLITNGSVTVNNTTNVIPLVKFGSEDVTRLTNEEILSALKKGYYATQKLVEVIHFNERLQEYQNLNFNCINGNSCSIFNGKMWETANRQEVLEKLIYDKIDIIEQIASDNKITIKLGKHTREVISNLITNGMTTDKELEVQKSLNNTIYDHSQYLKKIQKKKAII